MPFDHVEKLVELATGVYVDRDVLGIVEEIQAYDPNLKVKYLDPALGGELDDPPYKIVEVCPDGIERVVFGVWTLDQTVLARLWAADTFKQDIQGQLDRNNEQARENRKRRFREEVLPEAHDITVHVIKSPRTTYTIPGPEGTKFVYDSHAPTKLKTKTGLEVEQHEVRGA